MRHIVESVFLVLLLGLGVTNLMSAQSKIIFVKQDAKGKNDGSSWEDAFSNFDSLFTNLEDGLEVWISKGEYTGGGKIEWKLSGYNVSIFGGFDGTETSIFDRDIKKNETKINGYKQLNTLKFQNGRYLLDGLIIQNGKAKGLNIGPDLYDCEYWGPAVFSCRGGGIHVYSDSVDKPCNLTIKNCIIRKNSALFGGGLYIDSTPGGVCGLLMDSCEVRENYAEEQGGGIYIIGGKAKQLPFIISNTIIESNASSNTGGILYASKDANGEFELRNCDLSKNLANVIGGAAIGGHDNKRSKILNCRFMNNKGTNYNGGGLGAMLISTADVRNCVFNGNIGWSGNFRARRTNFTNCVFAKNKSYYPEDNLFEIFEWGNPPPDERSNFYNCSFYDETKGAKHLFPFIGQNVNFNNCAFEVTDTNLIFFKTVVDTVTFNYCSFNRKGLSDKFTAKPVSADLLQINNCLWDTPAGFRDTISNDFRLSSCSPLINKGSNEYIAYLDSTDLSGDARVQEDQIDIGAYETTGVQISYTTQANLCAVDSTGMITVTATGGLPVYGLEYNGVQHDTLILNNIQSGEQIIRFYDGTQCSIDIVAKFGPEHISFDTLIVDAGSKTSKDGAIKLSNIQGGNPPLLFSWSPVISASDSIGGLEPGKYTLTVTDSAGCTEAFSFYVSYPDAVDEWLLQRNIKLYPNPTSTMLTLELSTGLAHTSSYTIHCYDLLGMRCYTGTLPAYSYLHTIDVSAFAPGMYFIELTDGAGNMRVEKFVRE
ncbi:MAG TPA: T9SS type A sorting domain-containing protein [Saprospiraceae bacterium]|nr:T9SS type A sorting domain-containing protein [Saprospiraceae bacterium]